MTVQVKRRRDSATNIAVFTPAQGELIVDTTNNRMIVGDGTTMGGWPVAKLADLYAPTEFDLSASASPGGFGVYYIKNAGLTLTLPIGSLGGDIVVVDLTGSSNPNLTISGTLLNVPAGFSPLTSPNFSFTLRWSAKHSGWLVL